MCRQRSAHKQRSLRTGRKQWLESAFEKRTKFFSPGYDFWVNWVIPKPAGSQLWQVSMFTTLRVSADARDPSQCTPTVKTRFKVDVRPIGNDEEIIPDNVGSEVGGKTCLMVQTVVHYIGFGGAVHGPPLASGDIDASDAYNLLTFMSPPTDVYVDTYMFLKKDNCGCCPVFQSFAAYAGLPDVEILNIGGVGIWSK